MDFNTNASPLSAPREDTEPIECRTTPGPTVDDIARVGEGESVILDRRYRLLRELGRGGMGVVYLAECVDTGDPLAVKILNVDTASLPELLPAFLRETRLARRIHHPNVVRMFGRSSTQQGVVYLTMELLYGRNLAAYAASKVLRWPQIQRLMSQICAGVEAIHEAGVVHRDLKPSNCFVLDADDSIKILDFGISRLERSRRWKSRPVVLGTPGYMSPEQVRGASLDRRSDVYSAGALLFELACGRPPFRGESAEEIVACQLEGRVPRLCARATQIGAPPGLEAIVSRAMSARPKARFASMRELGDALARL